MVKHIAHVFLKDLLPDLERRRPPEVGVGVVGMSAPGPLALPWSAVGVVLALVAAEVDEEAAGETSAAVEEPVDGGPSSSVRGTYTQRFNPSDIFAFLHLLSIDPRNQTNQPTASTS